MSTKVSKRYMGVMLVIALALVLAMPAQFVRADGPVVLVDNLQASWIAPGGGGVWASYSGPPAYDMVSPGTTALYDGREAGVIKAGLTVDPTSGHYEDDGIFGFKPTVTIDDFAAGALTYDVANQEGTNPVWITIEIDTGVVDDRSDNTTYQHVPTSNPAGWHTVDAAVGQWQQWADDNGTVMGPLMPLSDVANAHTGLNVVRAFLRLGMGDSYHGTGSGTVAWVDKATLGGVTYDFVLPAYWYVAPTGLDTNEGTAASPFLTIQHAMDSASPGDTIHVATGTYNETVTIGLAGLTLEGAGDEAGTGTIVSWPGTGTGILVTASDVTVRGIRVEKGDALGTDDGRGISIGASLNNLTLDNVTITGATDGLRGGTGLHIDGLNVTDSHFDGNSIGWYISEETAAAGVFTNVNVTNSTFNNNMRKGIYVEKLDHALFDGITVANSGIDPAYNWNAGIDINLKWSAYQSIEIRNTTITNSGLMGSAINPLAPTGITIKARSDGGYASPAATLTGVTLTNVTVTGGVNGVRFGEPGKNNAGPTNVTVFHSSFAGYSNKGLVNETLAPVDARENWWGSASPVWGSTISGNIQYIPWCANADCTSTVTPPVHNTTQGTYYSTIQAAIDAANDGDALEVAAGTYDWTVNIDGRVGLTIVGEDPLTTIIKPSTTLPWNISTYGASRQTVVRMVNSTGITIEGLTFDMDLVKGDGRYAGLLWDAEGSLIGNTFKNNTTTGYYEIGIAIRTASATYTAESPALITISGNTFIDMGRVALLVHDFADMTIEDNTFYKTVNDFGYAIELGSESTGVINNNTIYGFDTPAASDGSNSAGIYIENAFTSGQVSPITKNVTVTGNEIYENQWGLYIGNEFNNFAGNVDIVASISDNNIHDNVDGGILVTDEDKATGSSVNASFSGNTIENNGDVGYMLYTSGDGDLTALVDGDTISGHGVGVYLEDYATPGTSTSSYDVAIHNSLITGNATYGVQNDYVAVTLDATENWWGDASGPGPVGPGAGDNVSANVLYDPWYIDEALGTLSNVAPATVFVDDDYTLGSAGGYIFGYDAFATIQEGIDAVETNGTVNAAAGTYPEQLNITKSLHLLGAGAGSSIILAPATMPPAGPTSVIVMISGSGVNAEISGFKVTGPGPSDCGSIQAGIVVRDTAFANIHDNTIADIRDEPLSGCQNGQAIWVGRQAWSTTGTATIANNIITDYQKGGIVVDNTGSNATITGNTITGIGTTSVIAQNGIQVSRGATATLSGNTVTGNSYHNDANPSNWSSAGVLLFSSGSATFSGGNSFSANDLNLYTDGTGSLTLGTETFGGSSAPAGVGADIWNDGSVAIDASSATFTGAADGFAIEDRVQHKMDDISLGLITWTANNVYVTPASGSIQRGIDAVSAGGTVNVAAGTYTQTGQIVINKNLTIAGADKVTTILKPGQDTGGGGDARGWFLVQPGVTFNLNNVTLDGSGKLVAIAVLSYGNGVMENNIIKNIMHSQYYGRGIQLYDTNMTIRNNQLENIQRIGIFAYGSGVTGAVIDGNTYVGKGSGDWLDYGIELGGGAVAEVMNNTVSNNLGVASVDGSTSAGMLVSTYFGAGTTANVHDNTFMNNTAGLAVGYNASDTSTVVARHNQFTGNTDLALDSTAAAVDARENWWGSAAPVWSSTVSEHVSYTPWCLDASCTTFSPEEILLGTPTGDLTSWNNTFSWTGISSADFYQLEVYDGNDTLIYSQWYTTGICTGLDCAVSPAETLNLANGNYKWKVRTYGISGFGDWTPFMDFTLDIPTLSLTSPTGTLTSWDNTFSWTGISSADFYQIELSDTSDAVLYSQWYTTSICTGLNCVVSPAETRNLANGDYKWKIRTYGSSGFTSWTDFTNFTVDVPTLSPISPTGILTTWHNTFSWTGIADADFYQIEVSDASDVVLYSQWYTTGICSSLDCAVSPAQTLNLVNGDYKWKVRTYSSSGFTAWTDFTNFTVDVPTLSLIAPTGTQTTWDNTFSWTGIGTADFYQLEVYTGSDTLVYSQWYTTGICSSLDCAVSPAETQNLANGDYKWKVRTYGSSGFTAWTDFTNFTLSAAQVVLAAPSGEQTTWGNTFSWTGIAGVDFYRLQVYDVTGGTVIFDQWYTTSICSGLDCAVSPAETQNLANGDYQWRVQTYGVTGFSPWTAYMDFSLNR